MVEVTYGLDAISALNDEGGSSGGSGAEFTSFKTNTTLKVKVLGLHDLSTEYTYGIFKKVNSFAATKPSKKSAKGNPVADYTPWDLAWKYHKDKSDDWQDEHGQEAAKYRPSQRFAFGFINLETGEPIIIDLSKKQGQVVYPVIQKNEKRLDKRYFELSKTGTGMNTVVMMSAEDLEDLTDKEREHFDNAPKEFDKEALQKVWVRKTKEEQVELLKDAGFDVSLIGFDPDVKSENGNPEEPPKQAEEENDDPTSQF